LRERRPHRYRGIDAHGILARIDRRLRWQQLVVVDGTEVLSGRPEPTTH
jgi:hypothetical protein